MRFRRLVAALAIALVAGDSGGGGGGKKSDSSASSGSTASSAASTTTTAAGTYPVSFAANDHGRAVTVISGTVVLTGGRTMGTMSGTALDKRPVTGRFSCS
jgi:hypothetical protein